MDSNSSVSSVNSNSTGTKRKKVGKNVVITHESISQLAEPRLKAHVYDDLVKSVHKNLAGNFAIVEKESLKNIDRIRMMLNAADQLQARKPAAEASGNHIARANSMGLEEHSYKVKRKPPRYKYEKAKLPSHTPVSHPDWNERFVFAEALESNKLPKLEQKESKADLILDEFRIGGVKQIHHAHSTASVQMEDQQDHRQSVIDCMIATYLFQKLPKKKQSAPSLPSIDSSSLSSTAELISKADLAVYERNKISWESIMTEFRDYSEKCVHAKDLLEIGNLRDPAASYIMIATYLCHLFGLPGTWAAAKKHIFRDAYLLKRFMQQVNPVHLPTAYLRSAVEHRQSNLAIWENIDSQHAFKQIYHLKGWCNEFNELAEAVIAVDDYRRSTGKTYAAASLGMKLEASDYVVADIHNERDMRRFYIDIKSSPQSDTFWLRFEKFYPLVYETKLVDDDDEPDADVFNDVDLTKEAAIIDIQEAIKHVTKPTTGGTGNGIRRQPSTKVKRDSSSRNIFTPTRKLVPSSGISKLLNGLSSERIKQSLNVISSPDNNNTSEGEAIGGLMRQASTEDEIGSEDTSVSSVGRVNITPKIKKVKSYSRKEKMSPDDEDSAIQLVKKKSMRKSYSSSTIDDTSGAPLNSFKLLKKLNSVSAIPNKSGKASLPAVLPETEPAAAPSEDLGSVLTDPRLASLLFS